MYWGEALKSSQHPTASMYHGYVTKFHQTDTEQTRPNQTRPDRPCLDVWFQLNSTTGAGPDFVGDTCHVMTRPTQTLGSIPPQLVGQCPLQTPLHLGPRTCPVRWARSWKCHCQASHQYLSGVLFRLSDVILQSRSKYLYNI